MTRHRAFLCAVIGLAALVRFAPALRRPLQVDEGYTLHVAGLPLVNGLQALRQLDVHPPLFLLLTHALVTQHVSDVAIRLVMATLGVVSVGMLYAIVRLWHGAQAALVAAFCAAVMPSLIFYDAVIRMYAPFDALALASFLVLSLLYTRDDLRVYQRRLLWLSFAILCAALCYVLYLGFAVVAAQMLFAAIIRRDGLLRSVAAAVAAFVLWLPQLNTFLFQLPRGGLAFPFYEHHQLAAFFELAGQSTIAVQTHGGGYLVAWASFVAWIWLVGALALAWPNNARSLAMWLGAPGALTLAYGIVAHKLLYTDRYYLLLAYALCAWTGVAGVRLAESPGVRGAWRAAAWIAASAIGALGFVFAFSPTFYTADWPAVADLLRARSQASDLIVFDQGSPYFVLERGDSLDHHPLLVVLRRREVDGTIKLIKPYRRVWLVLFQSGPVDPDGAVVHALGARYRPTGVWEFKRALPAETAVVAIFQR